MDDYNNLAVNALSQSIKRAVDISLSSAPFDITLQGRVVGKTTNKIGYYDVEIHNIIYSIQSNLYLQPNDFVKVMIPQGEPSNMFIFVDNPSECHTQYVYTQTTSAQLWKITHNLNKYPNIIVLDNNNNQLFVNNQITGVKYPDSNHVTISFSSSYAGRAILS